MHSCGHISINQIDLPEGYKAPKLTDPPSEYLSEPDGLINMSKYFELTEGTAILRTTIESPVDQQVDLIFDRDDNVLTLCEIKSSRSVIGAGVIEEIEHKREILQTIYPRHTIQPVLIYDGRISKDLMNSPYIYRKINATELI